MQQTTATNDRPAPAWFPRIAPTAAELADIEANDLPALEADCRDWHRFSAGFLAAYHVEQAATLGRDLRPAAAELLRLSAADLKEIDPIGLAA